MLRLPDLDKLTSRSARQWTVLFALPLKTVAHDLPIADIAQASALAGIS
jgi:hypothetical protein